MTINFSFAFFFYSHGLSTLGNDVCHRWLSKLKHHFSYEDCFGFWHFGSKLSIPLLLTKGYGSKVFSKNGQFSIDVPQDINHGDFKVSRSWDFVLLVEKVW